MKLSVVQPLRRVAVSRCQCQTRRRGGQRNLSEGRLLATLVQTCAASRYDERVERPKDHPAAIEFSLRVNRWERRHALLNVIYVSNAETNLLAASAPAYVVPRPTLEAGRRDQANLLPGIAIWSNACRLKRLTRL
jgi:hypothetical protein